MAQALKLSAAEAAAAGPTKARIIASSEISAPTHYEVTPDSTIIVGSGPTCGIVIKSPGVGPIQCMLALHGDQLELQPWPTASGTQLNGQEVEARTPLKAGDKILIGETTLTVESGPAPHETTPTSDATQEPTTSASRSDLARPRETTSESAVDSPPAPTESAVSPSKQEPDLAHESIDELIDSGDNADDPLHNDPWADLDEPSETNSTCNPSFDSAPNTASPSARVSPVFNWDEDELEDETFAILKAEIVQLQSELADRDLQLEALRNGEVDESLNMFSDHSEQDTMLTRIDDLLRELSESDERLSLLQTMLAASETATRAEQEERKQLEAWVGDIEQRLGENEAVRDAEVAALRRQIGQLTEQRDQAEARLASAAASNTVQQETESLLRQLRAENARLEGELADAATRSEQLQQQLESVETRSTLQAQQQEVDSAIREERARIAQQQAQLARERAELAAKLSDIERADERGESPGRVDDRVNALRDHLREIHQQEGSPVVSGERSGLMSRIAGLWNKLEQ